jgi:hypothetical protein
MTTLFKQAARVEGEGPVEVHRAKPQDIIIASTTYRGHTQHIYLTEHMAAKLVVVLAFMIGLPIANKVLKAVKM